ncbi:MAG: DsrE/DsrF/TusD sulfur relay family protein, partial [Shewanella sp.]
KLFNALRIAISLAEQTEPKVSLQVFLMSDAVYGAMTHQQTPALSYHIQQMLDILTAQGVPVSLCKTCCEARGITPELLTTDCQIGNLQQLSQWTIAADKVIHI